MEDPKTWEEQNQPQEPPTEQSEQNTTQKKRETKELSAYKIKRSKIVKSHNDFLRQVGLIEYEEQEQKGQIKEKTEHKDKDSTPKWIEQTLDDASAKK